MAKAFPNIAATDRDAESPVTADLVGDFHERDEAGISGPVDTSFAEASSTAAAYANLLTPHKRIFIPAAAASTGSTVTLKVVLEVKITGGTSCDIRVRLPGGTYQTVTGITRTTYDGTRVTFTIPAGETAAAADTETDLEIQVQKTGGGSTQVRCLDAASRLEAA